jgi:hypothetical protein
MFGSRPRIPLILNIMQFMRDSMKMKKRYANSGPYLIVGSQPQAVMFPRLQAAVTAYVIPAELIAYVKAASRLPDANRVRYRYRDR